MYIRDFRVERSLKSRAQLQLMHLLDQRASRSTSSIIDHPNAHAPTLYTGLRVFASISDLFQLKQRPCSIPVSTQDASIPPRFISSDFFRREKTQFLKASRHFFSNSRPTEAVKFSGKFIFSKRAGKIEEYVLISRGEKLRIPSSFHSPSKKRSSNNHVFRLLYDYPPRASKTDLSIPSTRCSIERPSSIEQTRATCT